MTPAAQEAALAALAVVVTLDTVVVGVLALVAGRLSRQVNRLGRWAEGQSGRVQEVFDAEKGALSAAREAQLSAGIAEERNADAARARDEARQARNVTGRWQKATRAAVATTAEHAAAARGAADSAAASAGEAREAAILCSAIAGRLGDPAGISREDLEAALGRAVPWPDGLSPLMVRPPGDAAGKTPRGSHIRAFRQRVRAWLSAAAFDTVVFDGVTLAECILTPGATPDRNCWRGELLIEGFEGPIPFTAPVPEGEAATSRAALFEVVGSIRRAVEEWQRPEGGGDGR